MEISAVHLEQDMQIGGGSGWVAGKIGDAQLEAARALRLLSSGWQQPGPGPHPREAALGAAREAVLHLNEALEVEAPGDALEETRHALEELSVAVRVLEQMGDRPSVTPGQLPLARFQTAIDRLVEAESRLREPVVGAGTQVIGIADPGPDTPRILVQTGNGGVVPPWLQ